MPCAYPHAKIRFVLIFSCTRSLALYLCSLSQEYIDARRPRREAADGSRHRIEYYFHRLSELRESRGRRGARDASVDAALAHACVRACLVLARGLIGSSAAASAAAAMARPSGAIGEAAQPELGAVSCLPRARPAGLAPGM